MSSELITICITRDGAVVYERMLIHVIIVKTELLNFEVGHW
jgi:hypothetical protein